jgi:hypothetical protein
LPEWLSAQRGHVQAGLERQVLVPLQGLALEQRLLELLLPGLCRTGSTGWQKPLPV